MIQRDSLYPTLTIITTTYLTTYLPKWFVGVGSNKRKSVRIITTYVIAIHIAAPQPSTKTQYPNVEATGVLWVGFQSAKTLAVFYTGFGV